MKPPSTQIFATDQAEPNKARAILHAAFGVFAQYGYRRTSMEDIARAAGVSRPALYLHFRNKEDIMRSMTAAYFEDVNARLEKALSAPDSSPAEALRAGFAAMADTLNLELLETPHGAEMMEQSTSVAADLVSKATERKRQILTDWLIRESARGRVHLDDPPQVVAGAIVAALSGAKAPPYHGYKERSLALATLLGQGLMTAGG